MSKYAKSKILNSRIHYFKTHIEIELKQLVVAINSKIQDIQFKIHDNQSKD